jgi:hypothetical protein
MLSFLKGFGLGFFYKPWLNLNGSCNGSFQNAFLYIYLLFRNMFYSFETLFKKNSHCRFETSLIIGVPLKWDMELFSELPLSSIGWLVAPFLPSYPPPSFPLRVSILLGPYLPLLAYQFIFESQQLSTSPQLYPTTPHFSTLLLAAIPYSLLHSKSTHLFYFPSFCTLGCCWC